MARLNLYAYIMAKNAIPESDKEAEDLFKTLSLGRNSTPDTNLSDGNTNNAILGEALKLFKINKQNHTFIDSYEDTIRRVFLIHEPDYEIGHDYRLFVDFHNEEEEKDLTTKGLNKCYKKFIKNKEKNLLKSIIN